MFVYSFSSEHLFVQEQVNQMLIVHGRSNVRFLMFHKHLNVPATKCYSSTTEQSANVTTKKERDTFSSFLQYFDFHKHPKQ